MAEKALWAIRVCTLALLPLGIQYEIVDGFTGAGPCPLLLPLSAWRKLVYFGFLFLLPVFFGAEAAFFAEPASDVAGPLVSVFIYKAAMKRNMPEQEYLGINT